MSTDTTDEEHAGGAMTLIEHLAELRRRIIICALAVVAGAIVVFSLWAPIIDFLQGPYADVTSSPENPDGQQLIFTEPAEAFLVRLKVATYGGIALAMPVLLWQLWRFITPGLHRNEKRWAVPFVLVSLVLFAGGAVLAWVTLPRALDFLVNDITGGELQPLLSAGKYLSLVTLIILAFGAAFEFPVLLMFLLLARVVSTDTLRRTRRWALVGIVTASAVITPSQDPYTLLFMAVPLYIFYEAVIIIGRILKR
ncbi:MAG TPA: twin-arginine translocase subunit TatC [Acidimicrobiia bacterium]|nr:twin-arginine translocase subunit TatC [Acidimicrobiia bacterium]